MGGTDRLQEDNAMAELVSQFEEALQNIEPSDDDKQNARRPTRKYEML